MLETDFNYLNGEICSYEKANIENLVSVFSMCILAIGSLVNFMHTSIQHIT